MTRYISDFEFSGRTMRRGDLLPVGEQRYALAAYVHRYTGQHVPAWAHVSRVDGARYPVQFASDFDWLANTWFPLRSRDGALVSRARGADCYSRPTWPHNPELREARS